MFLNKVSLNKAINIIKKNIQYSRQNNNQYQLDYCLLGRPGIGKTKAIFQMAQELGLCVSYISLSTKNKEDLTGVPSVNWDELLDAFKNNSPITQRIVYTRPSFLDCDILFIDEITNAELYEFTPIAQMISERRIGEHTLNPNTIIITAGNRPEHSVLAKDLPSIVVSRLVLLDVEIDVNELINYGLSKGWESETLAFVYSYQPLILDASLTNPNQNFVCPRTIEKSDICIKMYKDKVLDEEELHTSLLGTLGPDGETFYNFIKKVSDKLPYPELVKALKDNKLYTKVKQEYNNVEDEDVSKLISTVMDINYFLRKEDYDLKDFSRALSFIDNKIVQAVQSATLVEKNKDGKSVLDYCIDKLKSKNKLSDIMRVIKESGLVQAENEMKQTLAI